MIPPVEQVTSDGYDLQFGTNCLGHWYFTQLLMPTLLESAKTAPKGTVRVITTSSLAHIFHGPGFTWPTLQKGSAADVARKKLGTYKLYAQSKFVSNYSLESDPMKTNFSVIRVISSLRLSWRSATGTKESFRSPVIQVTLTVTFSGT